jgi:hypothetical protein
VAVLGLAVVPHPAVAVEFAPPLLVCRADQCIVPSLEFGDSPIPAGNCGPVSSDIHMLDGHVRILYKFMFYIKRPCFNSICVI